MARMEGKFVTYAACNHGSTALVTDRGELYMFGKDAIHCEAGTGIPSAVHLLSHLVELYARLKHKAYVTYKSLFLYLGFVSDLKNVRVKQVALGKVHVLVLTDRGQVYTFGYNGRQQCGRYSGSDFISGT